MTSGHGGTARPELPLGGGAIILGVGTAVAAGLAGLVGGGWGLVLAFGIQLPLISTALLAGGLFDLVKRMRSDPLLRTRRHWLLVVVGSLTTALLVWLWAPVYGGVLTVVFESWILR